MRIEQYFLMTDYSLWEVILNGDSPAPTRVVEGVLQPVAPTTDEQKLAKKNELKAHGTLLMAFPDKHQLKFNSHKVAKTLMEAIEKRFGGNTETKKVQKTLLKQQYENFTGSNSESLDQIHDRLQKLTSQLEIHGVSLYQKDVNLKFFSTTESVSVAASVSVVCAKMPVSSLPNVDFLSNAVIYSFFTSQYSSPQLDNEDLKKIDSDDLKEMDLKWQMAMLTMRARQFLQRTGRNIGANGPTSLGFYMSKVECYNCHRKGHFARECRSPKDSRRNGVAEPQRRTVSVETSTSNALVSQCDGVKKSVEARLLVYKQNESIFEEDIKLLNLEVQLRDNALVTLRQKLEKAKQERDDLKQKLEKFQTSSKNLTELLASQTNEKTSLGYTSQIFTHAMFNCDDYLSSESDESWPPSSLYNRFQPSDGYHVVPPPYTGTFMPPKPDLVFNTAPTAVETDHSAFNIQLSSTKHEHGMSHINRPTATIIEDWVYDSEDESETKASQIVPSFVQSTDVDHLIKDCDCHEKQMTQPTTRNHAHRGNHKQYAQMTYHNLHKHMVPTAVFTQSKPVSITGVRPVSTAVTHIKDNGVIDSGCSRHMTGNMSYLSDFEDLNGGYVAFGGNPKGGKNFGKEKIRTGKLDFDDVYFVKELKFNLFSVSQMCDKKNSVLFTDTECLVLSPDFKLPDESQVLLRVPWENNMLGHINFKTINKLVKDNLVRGLPSKVFGNDNTCVACKKGKQYRFFCKTKPVSSVDQPLYRLHMDLFGPTFVKSMNKKSYFLVVTDDYSRFNWVFFFTTKDETSPILKTFITGLENQLSLRVKVIRSDNGTEFKNNDLNQFCGIKGIKKEFSVPRTPQQNGIAERKNRTLIEATRTMLADSLLPIPFLGEAVNTGCYVQNRVLVTKPHNKTPYELLHGRIPSIGFMRPFGYPVTILTLESLGKFDENVNEGFLVRYSVSIKAFRVFNSRTRIVNKPNVAGSGPTWLFDIDSLTRTMNYQPVTARNQANPSAGFQDKFAVENAGEEINQQYVLFPVWSSGSTNPQNTDGDASFDGKEPNFDGKEPKFNEKKPESEVNVSPSSSAQSRKQDDKTKKEAKGKIPTVRQISPNSTNTFSAAGPSNAAASPTHGKSSFIDASHLPDDPDMPELEDITYFDDEDDVGAEADFNNLETSITVSPIPTTRVHKDHPVTQIIEPKRVHQALKDPSWIEAMQEELIQFKMQKVRILVDLPYGKRAIGTKWVLRNKKDERGIVVRNKARLIAQGHTQEEGINYEEVFAPVARIEAIILFLAYASFMGFMVYQMDVKSAFLYGNIEEEVYICQPLGFEDLDYPNKVYKVIKALYGLHQALRAWYETLANYLLENGFQRGKIDQTLFIKRQKWDILLVQIYVDDIIFGATNKDLCKSFEKLMKDKFYMSSMGELTFFLGLQYSIDTEKPFLKDPDDEDVDVHTYRSMIGSLIYLTSSRPDIMFTDSPFDLVAYSDSDYAGASLDRKSTTGGCQFLGCRLISWQFKKQTVVATSSTKAEYVAATSCCAQVLWIQNQLLDYGDSPLLGVNTPRCDEDRLELMELMVFLLPKVEQVGIGVNAVDLQVNDVARLKALVDKKKVVVTEATIREALRLDDTEGVDCLPKEEIFIELARMGYEKPSIKLMFYKAFFSSQWKFLIHTILQCMSATRTSWNEFNSSMASVILCLSS
nr:hypothetical protein [Tanacetum cinerariifolium]